MGGGAPRPIGRGAVLLAALTATVTVGCAPTGAARGATEAVPDAAPAPAPIVSTADLPASFRPDPDLTISMGDLRAVTTDLPPAAREAILARPGLFVALAAELATEPRDYLVLVDKERSLPADYAPADLVMLDDYADRLVLNREQMTLRAVVMPDLLAMVEAARIEGLTLDISSAYRSYAYQQWLFNYWTEELGAEQAARVSARPGHSQHQLGTTLDFGSVTREFGDTPEGRWLAANAWRFGFSLSYPDGLEARTGYSYEPWHFRHVGRAAARMEREFFDAVQQTFLEFWRVNGPRLAPLLAPVAAGA